MKNKLDFYMTEFVMEWDEDSYETAELIVNTSIADLTEHKDIVLDLLVQVVAHITMQVDESISDPSEVTELAVVIAWVTAL